MTRRQSYAARTLIGAVTGFVLVYFLPFWLALLLLFAAAVALFTTALSMEREAEQTLSKLNAALAALEAHGTARPMKPRTHDLVAGPLKPAQVPCGHFMPDGRSDICLSCDWPRVSHPEGAAAP